MCFSVDSCSWQRQSSPGPGATGLHGGADAKLQRVVLGCFLNSLKGTLVSNNISQGMSLPEILAQIRYVRNVLDSWTTWAEPCQLRTVIQDRHVSV